MEDRAWTLHPAACVIEYGWIWLMIQSRSWVWIVGALGFWQEGEEKKNSWKLSSGLFKISEFNFSFVPLDLFSHLDCRVLFCLGRCENGSLVPIVTVEQWSLGHYIQLTGEFITSCGALLYLKCMVILILHIMSSCLVVCCSNCASCSCGAVALIILHLQYMFVLDDALMEPHCY